MKPYARLPESVTYEGRQYKVDYSARTVLLASSVFQDPELSAELQIATALDLFIEERHPASAELLKAIIDQIKPDKPKQDGPQYMDIEQDWDYIYAAFRQAYGIDLNNDELHYLEFVALLESIPKETKLAEVVGIRAREVPTPNKHNQKEIQNLLRLKAIYALHTKPTDMRDAWGRLFESLKARAQR